jgi:hypothetical protein
MKIHLLLTFCLLLALPLMAAESELLAEARRLAPDAVTIAPLGDDGLEVHYGGTESISVPLHGDHIGVPADTKLLYAAEVRGSGEGPGTACLELWVELPERGRFFSRALHDPVRANDGWRTSETPFFFESPQPEVDVQYGLYLQGPIRAAVRGMNFRIEEPGSPETNPEAMAMWGTRWGFIGAGYGVLTPLVAVVLAVLANRGKGRRLGVAVTWAYLVAGLTLIGYGVVQGWDTGAWRLALPMLVIGANAVCMGLVLWLLLGRLHARAEQHRMAAVDVLG